MRMTTHEIALVVMIVTALLAGTLAKHYRHAARARNQTSTVASPHPATPKSRSPK